MKKVLILFIAWCMTLSVAYAQQDTTQVKVKYLNSFDAALKEAAQANKLIFVNCYAHWALPCQGMDRHVFSNAEFAKWLNDNFVCLRLEMTDPQNRYLIDKYKDTNKYILYFKPNTIVEINKIGLGKKKGQAPQAPRYSSYELISKAKNLDDLWK